MIDSIKSGRRDRNLSLLSGGELRSIRKAALRLGRVSVVTVGRNVADAVIFLASSTGEILRVDGGLVVRGE
jgi:NAD(P)-dependent dehydrogenase (short-subunit alcohol dehydrogenase family)